MSGEIGWYYAGNGEAIGPLSLDELTQRLPRVGGPATLVFGPGLATWVEARHVPALTGVLREGAAPPRPPQAGRSADEIDYEIFGHEMQFVEITLDPGEMVVAEAGAMMYMTSGIEMETVFGDPSATQGGFIGKMLSAGKRLITGESLFMTTFHNAGAGRARVSFAAPHPGKIVPMDLSQLDGELICQRDAFLCAARGVQIGVAFQKRFGAGLFGGEGFIMQRLTGDGLAMVHAGGTLVQETLEAGETLRVDTGCLVALSRTVTYDIQFVGGIKNTFFGGEGLFFASLTGPGEAWLQSLPFSRLAARVLANAPTLGRSGKEEGSLLGNIGGMLGDTSR